MEKDSDKLKAVLRELLKFGLDNDIYVPLHHVEHKISRALSESWQVANFDEDNRLLLRRWEWVLQTCRDWKLAYGRSDVVAALAEATRLGLPVRRTEWRVPA